MENVRKAYLQLSKKYHPDKTGNTEIFQEITNAYHRIMYPSTEQYITPWFNPSIFEDHEKHSFYSKETSTIHKNGRVYHKVKENIDGNLREYEQIHTDNLLEPFQKQ